MNIKSAVTTEGMPVKITPFSPEMLTTMCGRDAFQNILSTRIQSFFNSHEYVIAHEEFIAVCDKLEEKVPESKGSIGDIRERVTAKEVESFDEGYKAGMADLMTSLTLSDLQIIHTMIPDMESVSRKREALTNEK